MGLAVFAAIVIVSLLAGIAVQFLGAKPSRYDFLIVGVTATFGAYFASETFPGSTVFAFIIATVAYLATRDLYASPTTA
jgi:hypothetical protein